MTPSGNIATFSRGGSDITGAILARGFHADLYENFTDVNGIFAANPHIIEHPQSIKKMTYREMRELSYAGFSVFHDEALIPAIQGQIPINVKNTHDPSNPGTMIVPEKDFVPDNAIAGVTSQKHFPHYICINICSIKKLVSPYVYYKFYTNIIFHMSICHLGLTILPLFLTMIF